MRDLLLAFLAVLAIPVLTWLVIALFMPPIICFARWLSKLWVKIQLPELFLTALERWWNFWGC